MAEEHHQKSHEYEPTVSEEGAVQTKERGLFDFLGKKEEEKPQEEVVAAESEKVQVSEPEPKVEEPKVEEEKKPGLLEKLHRFGSSSSGSPSDEEGEEGEEKKKKKKKKEKGLKEKISGEKEEEKHVDTTVPVQKIDEVPHQEQANSEKEKVLGQHKKADEVHPPPPAETATVEGEAKEKKGIFEKIKEKLPSYHPKIEEEKERVKNSLRGDLLPLYHAKNEKKKERGRISLERVLLSVYHPKTEQEKERERNLIRRRKLCV